MNYNYVFPFGFWNYNTIEEVTPQAIEEWAECGITVTMTPAMSARNKSGMAHLRAMLDVAQEHGIKLIPWLDELTIWAYPLDNPEAYENTLREILDELDHHPAIYGFFIGDEPGNKELLDKTIAAYKSNRKLAPNLRPYLNFGVGLEENVPEYYGCSFDEWMLRIKEDTGLDCFCGGHYDQMWCEAGVDSYFRRLRKMGECAKKMNSDMWMTLLLSAHYMFRIPSEYDIMWQISTSVACGVRGITWFRFYDHHVVPNYHGSPYDEWNNKTYMYDRILRCQRRFHENYGEFIMRLHHKKAYITHKPYGEMDLFGHGTHPIITDVHSEQPAIVSFFEDDDGNEYLCLVNASQTEPAVYRVYFDREKYRLPEMLFNGKETGEYHHGNTEAHWDGQWLYPGQMCIYKLAAKA